MYRRILPILPALVLAIACDSGKAEARKGEGDAKKTAKADAAKAGDDKKADADKAEKAGDADKADAEKADAKTGDDAEKADKPSAEDEAKKKEERKARITKSLAEIEEWKTEEAKRWTKELEAGVGTLVASEETDAAKLVAAVLASPHRLPKNVERDEFRHPAETIAFFGIEPSMTVIEVGPGWGWYTEILAPMLAAKGTLRVTDYDPEASEEEGGTLYARRFKAFRERSDAAYGKIERIVQKSGGDLDLGAPASADVVFIVRGLHGWVNREAFDKNVGTVHAALKPGGIAAIVQHRAAADAKAEETAKQGYVPEAYVIEKFEAAGFELVEKSEINANAKDTHDHPEGVWTLPPTLALGDTDRDKYVGIGESDRMTLKFRKK